MFGILDGIKLAAGILAGLAIYHLYAIVVGYPSAAREARAGYVLQSEKDASDALVKKFQHDLLLGQQIREQADKAAENLDMENQKTEAANEKAIAANPGGSVVTADDVARIKRVLDAQ